MEKKTLVFFKTVDKCGFYLTQDWKNVLETYQIVPKLFAVLVDYPIDKQEQLLHAWNGEDDKQLVSIIQEELDKVCVSAN